MGRFAPVEMKERDSDLRECPETRLAWRNIAAIVPARLRFVLSSWFSRRVEKIGVPTTHSRGTYRPRDLSRAARNFNSISARRQLQQESAIKKIHTRLSLSPFSLPGFLEWALRSRRVDGIFEIGSGTMLASGIERCDYRNLLVVLGLGNFSFDASGFGFEILSELEHNQPTVLIQVFEASSAVRLGVCERSFNENSIEICEDTVALGSDAGLSMGEPFNGFLA
ncbi:hypothetical protein R3P38DRAFT_2767042 [Favolaschia claudopus]|uniref:Uncharacterized protein n=1 Tax=Favolaschia claudopus TaxID=2862362 RepID=A0AAW0CXN7_9AGAR